MKSFDVIVIGSGIAGLNFALRAAEKYERVLVITKKRVAESGTNFAQGGIAAVLSKLDHFEQHVRDTLAAGAYHNNVRAVEYMVKHGPAAVYRLMELGVPFATKDGKLLLTREGGHSNRRIAFVSDATGQAIERVLVKRVKQNPRITILEHTFVSELLVKEKKCYGVQTLCSGKFENIFGEMTVLATGGIGQLYDITTNPDISTGDGLSLAYRIGCKFLDLEFIQFHPTALKKGAGRRLLISEAVRGEGAYLRNTRGERFMQNQHPLAELAPRDIVARAIFEQEKSGGVFLDLRHKSRQFLKTRFPQIYAGLEKYGIDMAKNLIPVSPAAHYICGGIRVNLKGETGIKNLLAIGEVAGTGIQGANRLASNSLLEALVLSERVLTGEYCRGSIAEGVFRIPLLKKLTAEEKQQTVKNRRELKKTMTKYVGIVRTKESLEQALQIINKFLQTTAKLHSNERPVLELQNMLVAAKLITESALKRKHSLGCHFRTDTAPANNLARRSTLKSPSASRSRIAPRLFPKSSLRT